MSGKKKKGGRGPKDAQWTKAQRLCRLSINDVRKAKELGMSPKSLLKNIPSPTQRWKLPMKLWVRELHAKRFGNPDLLTYPLEGEWTPVVARVLPRRRN